MGVQVAPAAPAGPPGEFRSKSNSADAASYRPPPRGSCCQELLNPSGDKCPPTTQRELRGWIWYEFGTAAFFVGSQDFISVYVVSLAQGYAKSSWCGSRPGSVAWSNEELKECLKSGWAADYALNGTCMGVSAAKELKGLASCEAVNGTWNADWNPQAALVPVFGIEMGFTASYTAALTISIILQLIAFVFFGAVADYGNRRKTIFFFVNVISGVALMLMMLGDSDRTYTYILVLIIVVQTALNYAMVLYNSWLPLLAMNSQEVRDVVRRSGPHGNEAEIYSVIGIVAGQISGQGNLLANIGALIFLVLSVTMLMLASAALGEGLVVRINAFVCGVWILAVSFFCWSRLETRPGPPLPVGASYATVGIRQLSSTLGHHKDLREMFKFLAAYYFYSDGVSTMASSAAVFASVELHFNFTELIVAWFAVSICGIVSYVIHMTLQRRFKIALKKIIIADLLILLIIPCIGQFALTTKGEFYLVVSIYGIAQGGLNIFTRSLYGTMIPRGHESEFFALYQITDKGTAWAGPLLVAYVASSTGSFRDAFLSVSAFFVIGALLLLPFDVEKAQGQKDRFEAKYVSKDLIKSLDEALSGKDATDEEPDKPAAQPATAPALS
jgi:UMF1 family MFS transporter